MALGKLFERFLETLKDIKPNKFRILKLLEDKKMSISEIQRAVKLSYKETHRHVKELKNKGCLMTDKKVKEKHSPVIVSLSEQGKAIVSGLRNAEKTISQIEKNKRLKLT